MCRVSAALLTVVVGCVFLPATAAAKRAGSHEWPQWMGTERDGVWDEAGIVDRFPKGGPKVVSAPPWPLATAGPRSPTDVCW